MAEPRVSTRPAWIVLTALGVIVVVLAVVGVLQWQSNDKSVFAAYGSTHSNPGLRDKEQAAVDAAKVVVADIFSVRHGTNFTKDFNRALAVTTGDLHTQVNNTKSVLQTTLNNGPIDETAQVTAAGFEQSKGAQILVLVVANTYRVDSKGTQTLTQHPRLEVTMTEVKGTWLGSEITAVNLI